MPPVFGPVVAIEDGFVVLRWARAARTSRPSHRTMKLTSSPSETLRSPARSGSVVSAASASSRSCAMITPLPAARPSVFRTTGKPKRSSAARFVADGRRSRSAAVGIPVCRKKCFANNLAAFERARSRRSGRRCASLRARNSSTTPATSGTSGPTTVRSAPRRFGELDDKVVVGGCKSPTLRDARDCRALRRRSTEATLRKPPGKGVFAAAAANNENASSADYNDNNARAVSTSWWLARPRGLRGGAGLRAHGPATAMVTMNWT